MAPGLAGAPLAPRPLVAPAAGAVGCPMITITLNLERPLACPGCHHWASLAVLRLPHHVHIRRGYVALRMLAAGEWECPECYARQYLQLWEDELRAYLDGAEAEAPAGAGVR